MKEEEEEKKKRMNKKSTLEILQSPRWAVLSGIRRVGCERRGDGEALGLIRARSGDRSGTIYGGNF